MLPDQGLCTISKALREFDHVPRLTVDNQTLIELSLVQWREIKVKKECLWKQRTDKITKIVVSV